MNTLSAGITLTGRRSNNEDAMLDAAALGLFAVADGVGGYEGGEVASKLTVTTLAGFIEDNRRDPQGTWPIKEQRSRPYEENLLAAAAVAAHREILSQKEGKLAQMGSTVVAALLTGAHLTVMHCGDSRLYRVRAGALEQLSRDHSEAQDLVDRGLLSAAEARTWPRRNIITRALGIADVPELDMEHGPIATGDRFVICSDGLTTHVEDPEILAIAATEPPQSACDRLVALALERGGTDNVTVVIVAASDPVEAA
jgi:protein phosphatase